MELIDRIPLKQKLEEYFSENEDVENSGFIEVCEDIVDDCPIIDTKINNIFNEIISEIRYNSNCGFIDYNKDYIPPMIDTNKAIAIIKNFIQ